jgi:hypothetical protein
MLMPLVGHSFGNRIQDSVLPIHLVEYSLMHMDSALGWINMAVQCDQHVLLGGRDPARDGLRKG